MRLPVYERVVLHREILKSLESPERVQTDVRLNRLAEVMQSVSGLDVCERSRKTDIVREGFTQSAIGNFLKLDHSTICCIEKRMRDALSLPVAYRDYIDLYNKFTSAIL